MTNPSNEQAAGDQPRGRLHSLTAMPTHLIKLSPAFLEALRQVAPKTRRRKLPYVLALLVLAAGVVAAVPSTRQWVLARVLHRAPATASASADPGAPSAPAVATSTTTAPTAEWVAVVVPPQEVTSSISVPSASASPLAASNAGVSAPPLKRPSKTPGKTYRRAPR